MCPDCVPKLVYAREPYSGNRQK